MRTEAREMPTEVLGPMVGAGIGAAVMYALYQVKPTEAISRLGYPVWIALGAATGWGIGVLVSGDIFS